MEKISNETLQDLIVDSIINYGGRVKVDGKDGKYTEHHGRLMPGSETFAEVLAQTFKEIDDLPTVSEQMEAIREHPYLQWPIWLNGVKDKYESEAGQ